MAINWDDIRAQARTLDGQQTQQPKYNAAQKREQQQRQRAATKLPSALNWGDIYAQARKLDTESFGEDTVNSPAWRGAMSDGWQTKDYRNKVDMLKEADQQNGVDFGWYQGRLRELEQADRDAAAKQAYKNMGAEAAWEEINNAGKLHVQQTEPAMFRDSETKEISLDEYKAMLRGADDSKYAETLGKIEREWENNQNRIDSGWYTGTDVLQDGNDPMLARQFGLQEIMDNAEDYRNAPMPEEPVVKDIPLYVEDAKDAATIEQMLRSATSGAEFDRTARDLEARYNSLLTEIDNYTDNGSMDALNVPISEYYAMSDLIGRLDEIRAEVFPDIEPETQAIPRYTTSTEEYRPLTDEEQQQKIYALQALAEEAGDISSYGAVMDAVKQAYDLNVNWQNEITRTGVAPDGSDGNAAIAQLAAQNERYNQLYNELKAQREKRLRQNWVEDLQAYSADILTAEDFWEYANDTSDNYNGLVETDYFSKNMTKDEQWIHRYLYHNPAYGPDAARDYYDRLRILHLDKEDTEDMVAATREELENGNWWDEVRHWAGARVGNIISGVGALSTTVQQLTNEFNDPYYNEGASGEYSPVNVYTDLHSAGRYAGAVDKHQVEALNDTASFEIAGQTIGLGTLLQTGNSVVENIAGRKIFGVFSLLQMGATAANARMNEVIDNGGHASEAVQVGIAAGLAEYLTEKVSLESLMSIKNTEGLKNVLKQLGWQALTEGSEEVASEAVNTLADWIIRGDRNDLAARMEELEAQGYTDEQAKKQAWLEWTVNAGVSAMSGALSGGVQGGGTATTQAVAVASADKSAGKSIIKNQNAEKMLNIALKMGEGSEAARLAQNTKGARDLGKVYRQLLTELNEDYGNTLTGAVQQDVAARLLELGEQDANGVAAAVVAMYGGKTLTDTQRMVMERSTYGVQVLQELLTGDEGGTGVAWANRTYQKNLEGANERYSTVKAATQRSLADATKEQQTAAQKAEKAAESAQVAEDGLTHIGDVAGRITDIDAQGNVTITDDEGNTATAKLDDVQYATDGDAVLAYGAAEFGEDGAEVLRIHQAGQDVGAYLTDAVRAYKTGMQQGKLNNTGSLTAEQANMIYALGSAANTKTTKAKQAGYAAAAARKATGHVDISRIKTKLNTIGKKGLTAQQRKDMAAISAFAKALGSVDFVIYESKLVDGRYVVDGELAKEFGLKDGALSPNGAFDAQGRIWIDINAGLNNIGSLQSSMLRTAAHELTHYIRAYGSTEEWNALQGFVTDHMQELGIEVNGRQVSFDDHVQHRMDAEGLTHDEALEEVVADACEMMLKDSAVVQQLADEHPTMFRTVAKWIQRWLRRVAAAFEGVQAQSAEAKAMQKWASELQQLWDSALKSAVENRMRGNAEKIFADAINKNEKQFSMRNEVETAGNLIAVHNLRESNLIKAMQIGGFPMPSIAVTKSKMGHSNFGEISLVFGKETIDPKSSTKNKVFSADAWTPTFPRIEYRIDRKAERVFYERMRKLKNSIPAIWHNRLDSFAYGFNDDTTTKSFEEAKSEASENYAVMAAYLADIGKPVTMETRQESKRREYKPESAAKYEKLLAIFKGDTEKMLNMPLDQMIERYGDRIADVLPSFAANRNQERLAKIMDMVVQYAEEKNAPTKYVTVEDETATKRKMESEIDQDAFGEWLDDLLSGMIGDALVYTGKERFTPSGNRRSVTQTHIPATLENIAKAMAQQNNGNIKNVSGFHGVKTLRAVTAKTFRSVEEMHRNEGRLQSLSEVEQAAIHKELEDRMFDTFNKIIAGKAVKALDTWYAFDNIGEIIAETASDGYTAAKLKSELGKYGYEMSAELADELKKLLDDISQQPVNMFEAKPMRAVRFDEVKYAIVPDNIAQSTLDALRELVPDVRMYNAGDEAQRIELLNAEPKVRFSRRSEMEFITDKYFSKLIDHIEKMPEGSYIHVGKILNGSALNQVGMPAGELYFDSSKINKELKKAGIDKEKIKKLPELLRDPIVITKAKAENTINVFGNYYVGKTPILVGVMLKINRGGVLINKVRTLHPREDYAKMITDENVLYLNPNKKRTLNWFQARGNVVPLGGTKFGFISSIQYADEKVNPSEQNNPESLTEPQMRLSERRDENYTDTEVLAGMDISEARNDMERGWLKQVKTTMGAYNAAKRNVEYAQRKYNAAADNSTEKENLRKDLEEKKQRMKLAETTLERTMNVQPVRDMINRKAADRAQRVIDKYKEHAEKRLEHQVAKAEERAADRAQRVIDKYKLRKEDIADRQKLRELIGKRVRMLDKMLKEPTDSRHIPDELRMATLEFLKVFANNHLENGEEDTSVFDRERLAKVREAYEELEGMETDAGQMFDDEIKERLNELEKTISGKRLSRLTNAQLHDVLDIMEHFRHMAAEAGMAFVNGRKVRLEDLAMEEKDNLEKRAIHKEHALNRSGLWRMISSGQITPVYFARRIGGRLGEAMQAIIDAESGMGIEVKQARDRMAEIQKKYHYADWARKKDDTLTLKTAAGDTITLTREQALGLYATRKRQDINKEQNANHLEEGGVVLEKLVPAGKILKVLKYTLAKQKGMPISRNDSAEIAKWLTDEQKAYANEVVDYLSNDMAELGNETSLQLHGYSKFGEGYYYPYKTDSNYRKTNLGDAVKAVIKAMSFTKRLRRQAKNPIVITDFTQTAADHIAQMLLYHNFAVPQDTFLRLYDQKVSPQATLKTVFAERWGRQANEYIQQFLKDVYGSANRDKSEGLASTLTGAYKKQAVLLNLSVTLQQPASIGRALAVVDPKYFAGEGSGMNWDDIQRYAGTAVIKEIGRFDTNMGKGIAEWLAGDYTDKTGKIRTTMDKLDDWAGKGAELADRMTWTAIWNAVYRETKAKTKLTGEKLKQAAGKRFDEVIRLTQVYDSVMAKSEMMRSKSQWVKMVTSFMGEPTLTYNMVVDALTNKNNSTGYKARALGAVALSTVLAAIAKGLPYALRDEDDNKTLLEKWVAQTVGSLTGSSKVGFLDSDLSPVGYIPIVRDVLSTIEGRDVERDDMTVIADAIDYFSKALLDEKVGTGDKIRNAAYGIGMVTGVPARNVIRDIEGIVRQFAGSKDITSTSWKGVYNAVIESIGYDNSAKANAERVLDAYMDGDTADEAKLLQHMQEYLGLDDDEIRTKIKAAIKAEYYDGMDEAEAVKALGRFAGMDEDDAYYQLREWDYDKAMEDEEDPDSYSRYMHVYAAVDANTDATAAMKDMLEHGYTEDEIRSQIKSYIGKQYREDVYDAAEAEERMRTYAGVTDSGELYWLFDRWDYMAETGSADGYTKYDALYAAVDAGQDIKAAAQEMLNNGSSWSNVQSEVRSRIKAQYIAGNMDRQIAFKRLIQYFGQKSADNPDGYDANELYHWQRRADYTKETGESANSDYCYLYKYVLDYDGNKVKAELQGLLAHGKQGENIANSLVNKFEEEYQTLKSAGKAKEANTLRSHVLTVCNYLGFDKTDEVAKW